MDPQTKQCPYCAETILAAAIKCKHCGEFLDGRAGTEAAVVPDPATLPRCPKCKYQPTSEEDAERHRGTHARPQARTLGQSDYCSCGKVAKGRCVECGDLLCSEHMPSGVVVCTACHSAVSRNATASAIEAGHALLAEVVVVLEQVISSGSAPDVGVHFSDPIHTRITSSIPPCASGHIACRPVTWEIPYTTSKPGIIQ